MPAPHPKLPAPRRFEATSGEESYRFAEPNATRNPTDPFLPLRSPTIGERLTEITGSPNFQSLTDPGVTRPPDTNGAVGPNHVMTMLNSEIRIQDKAGNVVAPDVSLLTFWSATGVFDVFDPKLVFDQHIDRWLATCDANRRSPSSSVLFALSDTSDPTGMWTFYRFDADPSDIHWSDFPDIGFNRTWVAITNNMFGVNNDAFGGAGMWVIVKDTGFLTGGELNVTRFPPGFDNSGGVWGHSLSPCVTFGTDALASGFLHIVDNSGWFSGADGRPFIRISRISGDSPSEPTWSVVPGSFGLRTGFFVVEHNFVHDQILASQLGSTVPVSTNDTRMLNAVYRGGTLWCTHTGGLPTGLGPDTVDRTAVFWYMLNPFALPLPQIQSGVFDGGAGVHHMFPSIAVNAVFDAFIGFSRSDATRYVEAVFSQRHFADAPGEMDPITVLKAGEDSYEEFRWGDYSSTVVDPTDDLAFWTLQEYAATDIGPDPLDDRWSMWWGSSGVKLNGACCVEGDCVGVKGFSDCQALNGNLFIDQDCLNVTCPCRKAVSVGNADPTTHSFQPKNRSLSIVPSNPGTQTALRVTLTSSATFPGDIGKQWWVGLPEQACENSGQGLGAVDCGPAPGIPKQRLWSSPLVCNQECLDWQSFIDFAGNPLDVLHISDADIVTGSTYTIEAINCDCDPLDSGNFSTPLVLNTSRWGDLSGGLPSDCPRQQPDGSVDLILDCVAVLNKFSNTPCAMLKARADIEPQLPDLKITITDVLQCVNAFTGLPYPFSGPVGCP